MSLRPFAAALAAAAAAFATAAAGPAAAADQTGPIRLEPVALDPRDTARTTAGALDYLGGWRLVSDAWWFGGYSALSADPAPCPDGAPAPCARIGMIADSGAFAAFTLVPGTGEAQICLAWLRGADGSQLGKLDGDAEAMAILPGPDGRRTVAIGFERRHRIDGYDGLSCGHAPGPAWSADLSGAVELLGNQGVEGLALAPDGALLAGVESPSLLTDHPVLELRRDGAGGWRRGVRRRMAPAGIGFGLSDLAFTPAGNLLTLERFWQPALGRSVALGWIPGAALAQGEGRLQPRTLAVLEPPLTLDNFEGVAAMTGPDGRTTIFLISDDNFSDAQETLLMAFAFDEAAFARGEEGP